jgi:hypothetical protein
MASQAEQLAELVTVGGAGLAGLPRQLTHGDFWDGNVFFRGEALVFVADFGFLAERARIDDLAHPVLRRYRVRPHRPGPDRGPAVAGSRLHDRPGQPPHACRASGGAVGYRPAVAPAPRRPEGHASPGSRNRWPGPAATGQKPSARSTAGCLPRAARTCAGARNLNGPRGAVRDHRRPGARPGPPQRPVPAGPGRRAAGLARTNRRSGSPATMISGAKATVSRNAAADCDPATRHSRGA